MQETYLLGSPWITQATFVCLTGKLILIKEKEMQFRNKLNKLVKKALSHTENWVYKEGVNLETKIASFLSTY